VHEVWWARIRRGADLPATWLQVQDAENLKEDSLYANGEWGVDCLLLTELLPGQQCSEL